MLDALETDAEALIVDRIRSRRSYAIVPIDDCYGWSALSRRTGRGSRAATRSSARWTEFFEEIRQRAGVSSG